MIYVNHISYSIRKWRCGSSALGRKGKDRLGIGEAAEKIQHWVYGQLLSVMCQRNLYNVEDSETDVQSWILLTQSYAQRTGRGYLGDFWSFKSQIEEDWNWN